MDTKFVLFDVATKVFYVPFGRKSVIHHRSTLFIFTLVSLKGQVDEPWEPSNKAMLLQNYSHQVSVFF